MLLRLCALLVVGVTVCWTQKQPCCMPTKWEGKAVTGAADSMHGSVHAYMPEIAVDFAAGKFAVHELVMRGGHHPHDEDVACEGEDCRRALNVTTIAHLKGNDSMLYIIFWDHDHCIKKHIPGKAGGKRPCIPGNATYGGSVTIGGDKGVSVDRWVMSSRHHNKTSSVYDVMDYMDDFLPVQGDQLKDDQPRPRPRPKRFFEASIVVSSNGCVPVSEHVFTADRRSHSMSTTMFFDIKTGIKDPSVFDPPSFCKSSDYLAIENMELTPLTNYFMGKFD